MKKILFASSALVAAGAIATPALAADPIKLGLGGYFQSMIVHTSEDDGAGQPGANTHNVRMTREAEVSFTGSTTLDNGVTVGVNVQLEAETCGDQVDESYIYFKGAFGETLIGSENCAFNKMVRSAPFSLGGWTSVYSSNMRHYSTGSNTAASNLGVAGNWADPSGDNEKITYFSPKMGGFRLGVSYGWDSCEGQGTGCGGTYSGPEPDNTAGDQSNMMEIGAEYGGKAGDASFNLSAAYLKGDLEVAAAGSEDQKVWGIGGDVSMSGFTIGAGYQNNNQGTSAANTDHVTWAIGAQYKTGPWGIGAAYSSIKVEAGAGAGEDEKKHWQLGGTYDFGPGISFSAGIENVKLEDNLNAAGAENSATNIIVGTSLFF